MTRQTTFAEVDIHNLFADPWRKRLQFSGLEGAQEKMSGVLSVMGGVTLTRLFWISGLLFVLMGCGGSVEFFEFNEPPPSPPPAELPIDATPPKILGVFPNSDATDVEPPQWIQAQVDDQLDIVSVNSSTFLLYDGSGQLVAGTVTYSDLYQCWTDNVTSWCGYTIQFAPAIRLLAATQYTVVLKSQIKNTSGTSLASDYIWQFTTRS